MIPRQTAPGAEVVVVTLAPVPPLTIGSPRVQNDLVRTVHRGRLEVAEGQAKA